MSGIPMDSGLPDQSAARGSRNRFTDWGPRHDPRVMAAAGTADFRRVEEAVGAEYAQRAAQRIQGDPVMWPLRCPACVRDHLPCQREHAAGDYLEGTGIASIGMSSGAVGGQVSRVMPRPPGAERVKPLGCQVCHETGQVAVPCDHDGTAEMGCPRCGGTGAVCARCHGAGTLTITVADVRGQQVLQQVPCGHPDGTAGEDCGLCNGKGQVCAVCEGTGQRAVPCPDCASSGPRVAPARPPVQQVMPEPDLPAAGEPVPEFVRARRHASQASSIWR